MNISKLIIKYLVHLRVRIQSQYVQYILLCEEVYSHYVDLLFAGSSILMNKQLTKSRNYVRLISDSHHRTAERIKIK